MLTSFSIVMSFLLFSKSTMKAKPTTAVKFGLSIFSSFGMKFILMKLTVKVPGEKFGI